MSPAPSNHTSTCNLKLTPSNSHYPRSLKSPNKLRSLYESGLSLQKIIGATVSSPTAFDSLSSSCIFAYTAGATAVVVSTENDSKCTQRFFRARPTPIPLSITSISPPISINTIHDGKIRAPGGSGRDSFLPYSPVSPYASSDWADSSTSKSWTCRERVKAATCLCLSRDGKLLAVGETGYAPRILIFSLMDNSSGSPFITINEHTFGIRAVAFSSDGRYLASLGNSNDGFIYIWSINQKTSTAKLHFSNKCTSIIKQMVWMEDKKIVTVGTRHIKVWRITDDQTSASPTKQKSKPDVTLFYTPQPAFKVLSGRNVLLGPLVDVTFTSLAVISKCHAIVGSEKGDLCLLDDTHCSKLLKITNVGFSITCIAVDIETGRVKIGGRNGKKISIHLDSILSPDSFPATPLIEESSLNVSGHICAMGYAGSRLVTVDTSHLIEISRIDSYIRDHSTQNTTLLSHSDAVLGVCLIAENSLNAEFLTWSANGTIMFWDLNGTSKGSIQVELQQPPLSENEDMNECQNVRVSKRAEFLIYGDRYGVLRIVRFLCKDLLFETRAHFSDINDICLFEGVKDILLATCGRDRTVQLYRCSSKEWLLVQTLDEHSASVTSVIIAEDGQKLISSSTDRTIHIRKITWRENMGIRDTFVLPFRIITLKASPVSIVPYEFEGISNIIVSLLDRTVVIYEISTGRLMISFRASDNDLTEAVPLDSLAVGLPCLNSKQSKILIGVSNTDKSVRVYDGSNGAFIDKEWGHTTGVTGLVLHERPDSDLKTIISTGSDGTVMIWSLSPNQKNTEDAHDLNSRTDSLLSKDTPPNFQMPLRRVLSKVKLTEIQKESPSPQSVRAKSPSGLVRRKTSKYGNLPRAPSQLPVNTLSTKPFKSVADDPPASRRHYRVRSRSSLSGPNCINARRSSLVSIADKKGQTKGSPSLEEFGTLYLATQQACRTLRDYRKKLLSSDPIKDLSLKELDQELRLTAVALAEKSQESQMINESMFTGLLDQYSEKLVSMFDEKLRSSRLASNSYSSGDLERPETTSSSSVAVESRQSSSGFL